jgi:hypothetical protein
VDSAALHAGAEIYTLDLHTNTALIGREDLDVTLSELHLEEEIVGGVVDIYAVLRKIYPPQPGPEREWRMFFSDSTCWVSHSASHLTIETCRL